MTHHVTFVTNCESATFRVVLRLFLNHVTCATNRGLVTSRGVNPIISIHYSVTSSSLRQHPSEVGPHRSSQTFFWRQNWWNFFQSLHFITPRPRPVTTPPRSLMNSCRYSLFKNFLLFDPFFQCLLQVEPKGLTTGYKVHE